MNKIRLKVKGVGDRKSIVNALINNGYKVWSEIEIAKATELEDSVYVCFEVQEKEEKKVEEVKEEKKEEGKEVEIKPLGGVVVKEEIIKE